MGTIRLKMNKDQAVKWINNNITGALYSGEGELLYDLAKNCKGNGVIVEIGSLMGKSTSFLAFGSKAGQSVKVYAIDPFDGGDSKPHSQFVKNLFQKGSFFPAFLENMKKAGLLDIVIPIPKRSKDAVDCIKEPIELIFIDGAHDYEYVKMDILNYLPKVVKGGIVAFHDRNRAGVKEAIEEFIIRPNCLEGITTVRSILFGRKR
jgi:predicted O-methyltransferase YrrM